MASKQTFLPVLLAFLFWGASCSQLVKEDRRDCPCYLRINLSGLRKYPVYLSVTGAGTYKVERDTVLQLPVSRKGVDIQAVSGMQPGADGRIRIPYGSACPELYIYHEHLRADSDTARVTVQLHKQFCTLRLHFDGPEGWGEPYGAGVRGRVEGLYTDGLPFAGDFRCSLDDSYTVRIPRQAPEEELWMDVTMPDRILRSFALGSYMLKAGYDWNATDLRDLDLDIHLSISELRLSSGSWSAAIPLTVDI